jgi:DNA-binding NtrC family response regulator
MDLNTGNALGTVLVVDDDEGVRRLLARWVSAMGHTVKVASDAEAALTIMRGCEVDVALCDIRMPGNDGIWLLDQVRRFCPGIAVVLATGVSEMDPMITLRPGVAGYIVKPFNREEFEQVVKLAMAERQNLRSAQPPEPRLLPSADALDGIVLSRG